MNTDRRRFLQAAGLAAGAGSLDSAFGSPSHLPAPLPVLNHRGPGPGVEPIPRADHSTCLLQGNFVLVVGGHGLGGAMVSCQIYDPDNDAWYDAAPLGRPRRFHSSTLITGNRVLVLGGYDGGAMDLASVYDPIRDKWESVQPLVTPRYGHGAQSLPDGRVVLTGGYSIGLIAGAEVYKP